MATLWLYSHLVKHTHREDHGGLNECPESTLRLAAGTVEHTKVSVIWKVEWP